MEIRPNSVPSAYTNTHTQLLRDIPYIFDPIPPENFWAAAWHQALAAGEEGTTAQRYAPSKL